MPFIRTRGATESCTSAAAGRWYRFLMRDAAGRIGCGAKTVGLSSKYSPQAATGGEIVRSKAWMCALATAALLAGTGARATTVITGTAGGTGTIGAATTATAAIIAAMMRMPFAIGIASATMPIVCRLDWPDATTCLPGWKGSS